jgi:predicted porin
MISASGLTVPYSPSTDQQYRWRLQAQVESVRPGGGLHLSARTDVYVQGMYQHVSNVSTSAAPLNGAFIPGADAPSSSQNQFVSRVALLHVF